MPMHVYLQVPDPDDLSDSKLVPICLDYQQQVQRWLDRYQPLEQMFPDCWPARDMHPRERAGWAKGWDRINSGSSDMDDDSILSGATGYRGLAPHAPHRGGFEPPRWPARPPLRLNQLYWPTGASRWSLGAFLLADTEAQILIASMAASEGESPTNEVYLFLVEDDAAAVPSRTKQSSIYTWGGFVVQVLDLRPISCEGEKLWVLLTTDLRYFMNRWGCARTDKAQDYVYGIADVLTNMLDDRIRSSGVYCGSAPTSTYGWVDWAELGNYPAMWQLDALAASAGMRVVNNYGWSWSVEAPSDAATVLSTNDPASWPRIAGGVIPALFDTDPARFYFDFLQDENVAGLPSPYRVVVDEAGTAATSTRDQSDFESGLYGPDRFRIHYIESSASTVDEGGNSLSGFCDSLAEALAARFRDWNDTRYDYTFAGIMPWLPCGYDDFVLFNLGNQAPPKLSAMADGDGQIHLCESFDSMLWTRAVALPRNFFPTSLSHRSATRSRIGRLAPLIQFTITTGYTGASSAGDTDVDVSVTRFFGGENPDPTASGLSIKAPKDPDQSKAGTSGFAIRSDDGTWRAMSWMRIPDPI